MLALLTTFSSLLWLNVWHEINDQYGILKMSPFRNLISDSVLVFFPVIVAVFVAVSTVQSIVDGVDGHLSSSAQTALSVIVLSLLVSAVFLVIENNQSLQTGIGKDFALAVSICGSVHVNGFLFPWNFLLDGIPEFQAYRIYVLLQDMLNLLLANLGVTFLFSLTIEKVEAAWNSILKPRLNAPALKPSTNTRR